MLLLKIITVLIFFYDRVEVIDNYQWLEDNSDPKVLAWDEKQNEYTHWYLDKIPNRST